MYRWHDVEVELCLRAIDWWSPVDEWSCVYTLPTFFRARSVAFPVASFFRAPIVHGMKIDWWPPGKSGVVHTRSLPFRARCCFALGKLCW